MPKIGTKLATTDQRDLRNLRIPSQLIQKAGLRRLDAITAGELLHETLSEGGLFVPHLREGKVIRYRIRMDSSAYLSPPGELPSLYLPPTKSLKQLQEPALPLVLVRNELAALSLCGVTGKAFLPAAICGDPIPDAELDQIQWSHRSVYLLFPPGSEAELIRKLARRGAQVACFVWSKLPAGITTIEDLLTHLQPFLLWRALVKAEDQRLPPPQKIEPRTKPYRNFASPGAELRAFLESRCLVERHQRERAGRLYAAYREWSQTAMTWNEFGAGLARRFAKSRDRHGVHYHGLRLRAALEADPEPFLNEEMEQIFGQREDGTDPFEQDGIRRWGWSAAPQKAGVPL